MRVALLALLLCACDVPETARSSSVLGFSWDLEIDADDAAFSGGALTAWPTTTGQTFTLDTGYAAPTNAGPVAGGVTPVTFDADGRLLSDDALIAGSVSGYTVEVVHDPADVYGWDDRQYFLYFRNNTNSAPYHHAIAHIANTGGTPHNRKGTALGGAWSFASSEAPIYGGLQVETWVIRQSQITLYRNGHVVDHVGWPPSVSPTTVELDEMILGAAYGEPLAAPYRGALYSLRGIGRALTRSEVLTAQAEQIERFDIASDYDWQPSDESALTGWWDEHGLATGQWINRTTAHHLTQGTTGQKPGRTRVDGHLAIACDGTDDSLGGQSIATYLGASSYEYAARFTPHSCNSTDGAAYTLEFVLGDTSGFVWLALKSDGSGGCTSVVGHWGTAAQSVELPGIVLNEPHTVHVWYSGGTLYGSLDGATAASRASTTAIGTSTAGVKLCGRGTSATSLEADVALFVSFGTALSTASRVAFDTWLGGDLDGK